jgi:hypothetical protein
MISSIFSKKIFWLVTVNLLIISSVHAELMNVGPTDRLYEYLFFDGQIQSGTSELNIFSGINDNGTWKASTSVDKNWKTASASAWQNAVEVYNPGAPKDILPNTQAKFIWAPNTDGSNDGKYGATKAYFSYTFNLNDSFFEAGNTLSSSAHVLADDFFAMSVNGHFVGNGLLDTQIANNPAKNGLGTPVEFDFGKWLKNGNNTISIFAYDGYKVEQEQLINRDTIKAKIIPPTLANSQETMEIRYSPNNNSIDSLKNLSISDAADILGYDHFNWYQIVTGDKKNAGLCSTNPCTDPPINYSFGSPWDSSNKADSLPFYWDECTTDADGNIGEDELIKCKERTSTYLHQISEDTIKKTAEQIFSDSPQINARSFNNKLIFDTFFVGVIDHKNFKDQWDPLYHLNWVLPKGAGIAITGDTQIESKVKACMLNDGARISSTESIQCLANVVSEPPEWALFMFVFFLIKRTCFLRTVNNRPHSIC